MIRLFFLLPILLCFAWYYFLKVNRIPLKQGKKGFFYIMAISCVILVFFTLMLHITKTN